jgi:hypothetical protein
MRGITTGPPPAVRLACDCSHCAEADWFLRRLRAWRELEVHTYPPLERIRRQLLWRGVSHFTYLDAMRLAEMCLRALDEAEEAFQADAAEQARAELAAQLEKPAQVQVAGGDEDNAAVVVTLVSDHGAGSIERADSAPTVEFDPSEDRQSQVFEQLRSVGLTDREIAVLARLCEGHTQRETAKLCGDISKTYVVLLTSSALTKITKAGLNLKLPEHGSAPEIIPTDPDILDNRTAK